MKRTDIINHIIKKRNYNSYLEIGVWGGNKIPPYTEVMCPIKVGVDPNPNFSGLDETVLSWTSDQYFDFLYRYTNGVEFDLIFIDGLHLEEQVDRDIENSLNVLSEDGIIILHDCSPLEESHAKPEWDGFGSWNGTVYKSIVKLRCRNSNLFFETVDTDHGCGILDPYKTQDVFSDVDEDVILNDFSVFDKHRKDILNLISVDDFLKKY